MKLNIVVMVWGEKYINQFIKWGLPSLLAPRNLPELARIINVRVMVLMKEHEMSMLTSSSIYQELIQTAATEIFPLPNWPPFLPACTAQYYVQKNVLSNLIHGKEAVLFCSPDVIWTDGSISHVGRSLQAENMVIYLPTYRVVEETIRFDSDLKNCVNDRGAISITPLLGGQLLLRHAHPLLGAFHFASLCCPPHIEYVTWPVGHEGVMMVHLVRGPDCHVKDIVDWTMQGLVSDKNQEDKIDAVYDSNVALGLSITPLSQCSNWIIDEGRPSDYKKFGQFMARHFASLYGLLRPVMVWATDMPDRDLWEFETSQVKTFFDQVRYHRDMILSEEVPLEDSVNCPQSYGSSLSSQDYELYEQLLWWVPPDCETTRLLRQLGN